MALLGKIFGTLRSVAKRIFTSPDNPAQEVEDKTYHETAHAQPRRKGNLQKTVSNPAKPKKQKGIVRKATPPPRPKEKLWEYKGVSKSAKDWASQYGVTVSAMRYRLNTTGAPECPGRGFIKEPELYEYNGKRQSIADWAKEIGVSEHSIRWRIKKYGGIEIKHDDSCFAEFNDIKIIEEDGHKKIEADGKVYSIQRFCKDFGVSFGTFYGRMSRGWDIKDAIKSIRVVKRDYKKNPATKPKLWEWNGEKHTVDEWAKIFGVKRAMMRIRLLEYGSPERNTEKLDKYFEAKREKAKHWEWNGGTHSIKEWAEIYRCPERTMAGRLARYGSPEPPKKIGIAGNPKLWEWEGEKHTVEEWAKIVGKSASTVRTRLRNAGNPYQPAQEGGSRKGNPKNLIFGVEKSYTWNGQTKTSSEWAKEYNCTVNAIRKRFNANGSPEPKIEKKPSAPKPKEVIASEPVKKKEPKQEEKKKILYGYNGDWKTIQEWAKEYHLPEWKVKNNFTHYGVPDDSVFGKDTETSSRNPVSEIDKAIAEGETKSKGRKREPIKEWLERIRNEPDDGRPLREILGIPKEDSFHTLDHIEV